MVKVIPVPAFILVFVGMMLVDATVLGWIILMAVVFCLVAALFLYIVKEVWVYDRWMETRKNVMKEDVYAVPVETGQIRAAKTWEVIIDVKVEWNQKKTGNRIPGAKPAGAHSILRDNLQQKP